MLDSSDIFGKKFERVLNGYKAEEVDKFLSEISEELELLKKENNELHQKLQTLAAKLQGYREQEDDIKKALIYAQKEAKQIITAAESESEIIRHAISEENARILSKADKTLQDAKDEAEKFQYKTKAKLALELDLLEKSTKTTGEFRSKIIKDFNTFLKNFENLEQFEKDSEILDILNNDGIKKIEKNEDQKDNLLINGL